VIVNVAVSFLVINTKLYWPQYVLSHTRVYTSQQSYWHLNMPPQAQFHHRPSIGRPFTCLFSHSSLVDEAVKGEIPLLIVHICPCHVPLCECPPFWAQDRNVEDPHLPLYYYHGQVVKSEVPLLIVHSAHAMCPGVNIHHTEIRTDILKIHISHHTTVIGRLWYHNVL
jgi:hypothetical protein